MQALVANLPHGRKRRRVDQRLGHELDAVRRQNADDVGRGLGVGEERLRVGVVNVVARLVVASVLLGTRAREEAANGLLDDLLEGNVIGAARETDGARLDTLGLKVVEEELLNSLRAGGAAGTDIGTVAVKDAKEAARDHVKVDVEKQVINLGRGHVVYVKLAAPEAVLLGTPPREPHLEIGREARQGLGELENEGRAGAVIVDAGPGLDRVEMRADHDDVARVATLGLCNDVLRDALFNELRDLEVRRDSLARVEARLDGTARTLINQQGGNILDGVGQRERAGRQLGRVRIVNGDGNGAGGSSSLELASKGGLVGAHATLDEDDLALGVNVLRSVVGGRTASGPCRRVHNGQVDTLGTRARRVGQADGAEDLAVNGELLGRRLDKQGREILLSNLEALELLELAVDVVD
ncbi:hypothetical protein VDGD_21604 [Verticillium dahliae]|nr:hypothetical protein VDGD_21604 [Verticillium dahliae]